MFKLYGEFDFSLKLCPPADVMASAGINCCSTVSQRKCIKDFKCFNEHSLSPRNRDKPAFAIAFIGV